MKTPKQLRMAVTVLALALALTRGAVAEETTPETAPLDVVLALDNSGSMRRNDPNALMRPVVRDLAGRLAPEARLGIVLFDDVVKVALPLTPVSAPDFQSGLDGALKQLTYRGRRTEIPGGVERAVYELRLHGRPEARRAVVFLTDGIVDVGDEARNRDRSAWLRDTVAAEARDGNILVFGIGFTEQADFSLIQALAQSTGGGYRRVLEAGEISAAFEQVEERLGEIAHKEAEAARQQAEAAERRVEEEQRLAEAAREVEAARADAAHARDRAEDAQRQAAETMQQLAAAKAEADAIAGRAEAARQEAVDAKVEAAAAKALAEQKPPVIRKNSRIVQRFPIPMDWRPLVFGALVAIALVALVALRGRRGPRDTAMPAAKLRDLRDGAKHRTYKLRNGGLRIGRAKDNDVVLPYETVSAHHAVIEWRDGSFHVKDLASTNGTRRNGTPFGDRKEPRSVRVMHRDRIAVDAYEFEFLVGAADKVADTVLSVPFPAATLEARRSSSAEEVTRIKPQPKCADHPSSDATQRCPACGRTSCEWCITEKDGKVMCVACAQQAA